MKKPDPTDCLQALALAVLAAPLPHDLHLLLHALLTFLANR